MVESESEIEKRRGGNCGLIVVAREDAKDERRKVKEGEDEREERKGSITAGDENR